MTRRILTSSGHVLQVRELGLEHLELVVGGVGADGIGGGARAESVMLSLSDARALRDELTRVLERRETWERIEALLGERER